MFDDTPIFTTEKWNQRTYMYSSSSLFASKEGLIEERFGCELDLSVAWVLEEALGLLSVSFESLTRCFLRLLFRFLSLDALIRAERVLAWCLR